MQEPVVVKELLDHAPIIGSGVGSGVIMYLFWQFNNLRERLTEMKDQLSHLHQNLLGKVDISEHNACIRRNDRKEKTDREDFQTLFKKIDDTKDQLTKLILEIHK